MEAEPIPLALLIAGYETAAQRFYDARNEEDRARQHALGNVVADALR